MFFKGYGDICEVLTCHCILQRKTQTKTQAKAQTKKKNKNTNKNKQTKTQKNKQTNTDKTETYEGYMDSTENIDLFYCDLNITWNNMQQYNKHKFDVTFAIIDGKYKKIYLKLKNHKFKKICQISIDKNGYLFEMKGMFCHSKLKTQTICVCMCVYVSLLFCGAMFWFFKTDFKLLEK